MVPLSAITVVNHKSCAGRTGGAKMVHSVFGDGCGPVAI